MRFTYPTSVDYRALPIAILAALLAFPSASRGEETLRPYDDGALAADDFQGEQPADATRYARTVTQIRYTYRCETFAKGKSATATLRSVDISAYIRRDTSWNARPDDAALLDHEQGHADIAQIECLRARLAMRDKLRGGFSATAATAKQAAAALDQKIAAEIDVFIRAMQQADTDYDRATMHGLGGKQAEWRRVQQATIQQLQQAWRNKNK